MSRCPICEKATDKAFRPFCSKRCADVDLGRWMSGAYAVASQDPEDFEELEQALDQEGRGPFTH